MASKTKMANTAYVVGYEDGNGSMQFCQVHYPAPFVEDYAWTPLRFVHWIDTPEEARQRLRNCRKSCPKGCRPRVYELKLEVNELPRS